MRISSKPVVPADMLHRRLQPGSLGLMTCWYGDMLCCVVCIMYNTFVYNCSNFVIVVEMCWWEFSFFPSLRLRMRRQQAHLHLLALACRRRTWRIWHRPLDSATSVLLCTHVLRGFFKLPIKSHKVLQEILVFRCQSTVDRSIGLFVVRWPERLCPKQKLQPHLIMTLDRLLTTFSFFEKRNPAQTLLLGPWSISWVFSSGWW